MPTVHCSHRGPRGPVKREEEEDRQRIPNYLQDERAGPWVKRHWRSRPSSQLRAYYQEWREVRKHFYVSWHSINLTTRNQAKFTMVFMPIIRRGWWERKKRNVIWLRNPQGKPVPYSSVCPRLWERGELISVANSPTGLTALSTHPVPSVMSPTSRLQNLRSQPVLKHSLITPY